MYQLTSGQLVNKHTSVDRLSRTIAGPLTKTAQFGLPVLFIIIVNVSS